jgi:hypothetical protein
VKLIAFFSAKIFRLAMVLVFLLTACQSGNTQNTKTEDNTSGANINTPSNSNTSSITNSPNNIAQSESTQTSEVAQHDNSELYGNTNANIANGAFVTFDGSYTFYSLPVKPGYVNFQGEIVKVDSSETNKKTIQSGDRQGYLNYLDGWIYYISNGLIYKVKDDGSEAALITTTNFDGNIIQGITSQNLYDITSMTILGPYIYCSVDSPADSNSNINGIYRINTSDGEIEQLSETRNTCLTIYDNWIYYNNANDNWAIYKMKIDGAENTKVCNDEGFQIIIDDNVLYYIKAKDSTLNTINLQNGDTKQFAISSPIFNINTKNGWIYYTTGEGLYRIRNDGTEDTRICDFIYTMQNIFIGGINIVDDWIYFMQYQNNVLSLHRIKIDGANIQIVQ